MEIASISEDARNSYIQAYHSGARVGPGGGKTTDVDAEQSLESFGDFSQPESESII